MEKIQEKDELKNEEYQKEVVRAIAY